MRLAPLRLHDFTVRLAPLRLHDEIENLPAGLRPAACIILTVRRRVWFFGDSTVRLAPLRLHDF